VADLTVTHAQREETRTQPAEAPAEPVARSLPPLPRLLMVLWAGSVLAMVGFLVFGTLRIGAGNWIGRRMPIRLIWSRFLDFLTNLGASGTLIFLVAAAAVATLIIAAVGLWLALGLQNAPPEPAADTSAEM
jgi:hypothetical protein